MRKKSTVRNLKLLNFEWIT